MILMRMEPSDKDRDPVGSAGLRQVCGLVLHALPGSGKSTLVKHLRSRHGIAAALDIDELLPPELKAAMASGRPLLPEEREMLVSEILAPAFIRAMRAASRSKNAAPAIVVMAVVLPTSTARARLIDDIVAGGIERADIALVRLSCGFDELLDRVRARGGGHFAGEPVLRALCALDLTSPDASFDATLAVPTGARSEAEIATSTEVLADSVLLTAQRIFRFSLSL